MPCKGLRATENPSEPHLHFHLSDGATPLGAGGLPYGYDAFELVGRCARPFADCAPVAPETRPSEIPLANMIVRFRP